VGKGEDETEGLRKEGKRKDEGKGETYKVSRRRQERSPDVFSCGLADR
jgi:hypothetical protein